MPYQFLDHLDVFVALVAGALTVFNLIYFRRLNSTCIALVGFVLIQSLSNLITSPIRDLLSTSHPNFAAVLFYFSFAFIDLTAIVIIYRLHRACTVSIEESTNFCVRCIQFLAALQVIRYLDRIFGFDVLGQFYQLSIPVVNLAILLILTFATVAMVLKQRAVTGVKGI